MRVLVTGAYGYLGRHCVAALSARGHEVMCGGRPDGHRERSLRYVEVDFSADVTQAEWVERLPSVDVVLNAIGIIAERPGVSFASIHEKGPRALFGACAARGIQVVNVSALGADSAAASRFHETKRAADDYLLAVHPTAIVVQPSIVLGTGGASTR